jgi:hypothetical protein
MRRVGRQGGDVKAKTRAGTTPLHDACYHDFQAAVRLGRGTPSDLMGEIHMRFTSVRFHVGLSQQVLEGVR